MKIDNVGRKLSRINNLDLHFQRCRELEVDHHSLSSLIPYFHNPTTLRALKINGQRNYIPRSLIHPLPSCPALTHLEIEGCLLQWGRLPVVSTLKTLKLDNSVDRGRSGLIMDMHQVLSSMPALEVLDLVWMCAWEPRPPFASSRPPVVLENLRTLNILDREIQDVQAFLASISIPPATTLDLEVEDRHDEDREHVPALLHSLATIFNNTSPSGHGVDSRWQKHSKLELNTNGYGDFFRSSCWDDANGEDTREPKLTLRLPNRDALFHLAKLREVFGLTYLRWFSIIGAQTLGLDAWLFFASVTGLEKITFSCRAPIPVFLSTLAGTVIHPLSTGDIPFPGLRELEFDDIDFEPMDTDLPPLLDTLFQAIKGRPAGQQLRKVTITRSGSVEAASVERLREVVEVNWDNVEEDWWEW